MQLTVSFLSKGLSLSVRLLSSFFYTTPFLPTRVPIHVCACPMLVSVLLPGVLVTSVLFVLPSAAYVSFIHH
jgi:hypothetical protein